MNDDHGCVRKVSLRALLLSWAHLESQSEGIGHVLSTFIKLVEDIAHVLVIGHCLFLEHNQKVSLKVLLMSLTRSEIRSKCIASNLDHGNTL